MRHVKLDHILLMNLQLKSYLHFIFVLCHIVIICTTWVRVRLSKLPKGYSRVPAASDKAYQLLAHCWWFSPGTPASSATTTGRRDSDIAKTLL